MLVIKLKEQIRVNQGALSPAGVIGTWSNQEIPSDSLITSFFTEHGKPLTAKFSHFNPTNDSKCEEIT